MNLDDSDNKSMDGQEQAAQQAALSSMFPLPPMRYIKLYTDANVRNKSTPPPPKPFANNGQFLMFGQTIQIEDSIIRSLENQGLRRIYPREYDHKRELKKINASILVNFLDLIDVLIRCPDTPKREEKCNHLQTLFITMHHLINELRPHQARESIRVSLQAQKKQRIETTTRLLKQIDRIQDIIKISTEALSDHNIASIMRETLPENFVKPTVPSDATTSQTSPKQLINGHGRPFENGDNSDLSKMSEMDAFMCDLVDEIF